MIMSKGVFSQKVHTLILFFSFALIAIGMPTTKVFMSFGLVLAIANWILEGRFNEKWKIVQSNRLLILLISFYLLLIIGLLWSWDVTQGLKDLKSRLPLLFLPLIFATSPPLDQKYIRILFTLFLTSLFLTSLFNVLYFNFFMEDRISVDIRGLSYFSSHIRYGLLIVIGFVIAVSFQLKRKSFQLGYSALAVWFAFYTIYSQVLSGISALILVVFTITFYLLYKWKEWSAFVLLFAFLVTIGSVLFYLLNLNHEHVDCSKLPPLTENGEKYNHDCTAFSEINEKAILTYYSEIELYLEWIKVSDMDFMKEDMKGNALRMTAARYMTSLGLTKDKKGFQKLTKQDIKNIEEGYTYPNERNEIIMPRLYGIKYQLLNNVAPNGHSILQRLEHWKTSIYIIKRNWLFGVGTGGNQKAFDKAYEETNSPLNQENRVRSHNMFLTYIISYGIGGFLLFCTLIFCSFRLAWRNRDMISFLFLVIISCSFLTEDTLESQLGVTYFGFFMAILFYNARKGIKKELDL